jgi:hypothetical protein
MFETICSLELADFFSGLGTEIVILLAGLVGGWSAKSVVIKQKATAGKKSTITQIGKIDRER